MSMTIANIHWLLDPFDELGITVWVDGGGDACSVIVPVATNISTS